ncbi:hypothetical protein JXQ70_18560 [bacterium]|nr:hypothetical protein [bacterium]
MSEQRDNPLPGLDALYTCHQVEVEQGIRLMVYQWQPASKSKRENGPLVFVAGCVSSVEGWTDFLQEIIPIRPVYYIESREKQSTVINRGKLGPADFSIRSMSLDIISVCQKLGIMVPKAMVAGSSLGATALLEALKEDHFQPRLVVLIGPNTEFRGPWFSKILLCLPASSYHLIKHFIIWYLGHFRVDRRREPEQMERYKRTLLEADPYRLKLTVRSFFRYKVWPGLEKVTVPIVIAYSTSDTLHVAHNIRRMRTVLARAELCECRTNLYMHSAAFAQDCERLFLK